MDTASHVLTVALPVNQLTVPERTNVLAATLASDSMVMDNAKHAIQHALPAATPGKPIHAYHVLQTLPWELQVTAYVTSLRFV